jgi:hypothetical protein
MKAINLSVWLLLAAVSGYAMFHITFEVERLEDRLRDVKKMVKKERDDIHHLKAEWSYLNRPDRLSSLAKKWLPDWTIPKSDQITRIDRLSEKIDQPNARPDVKAAAPASLNTNKEHRPTKPERLHHATQR